MMIRTLLVGAALAVAGTAFAGESATKPEYVALKFHADWCGSCKAIDSYMPDLENKLDGQPVLFVELDFTNQTSSHRARMLAGALGVGDLVAEKQGTGFILLVDGEGNLVQTFTKNDSMKDIAAAIQGGLSAS